MVRTETIQINVDDDVWENAETAFDMCGVTISEAFNSFLKQIPPPPARVVVKSRAELIKKLEEADEQIQKGDCMTFEEFRERLNAKYGI